MSKKLEIIKNFVVTHRGKIAAGATAAVLLALVAKNQSEFNKFLESKGLLDEYYSIEN